MFESQESGISLEECNNLNFDITLMGISPIDYDVNMMFYFDILGLGTHCI